MAERSVTSAENSTEPAGAELLSLSDSAVDSNGNGVPDQLRLAALVKVTVRGRYQLAATLTSANGQEFLQTAEVSLAAGTPTVVLNYPSANLVSRNAEAPYSVKDLVLRALQPGVSTRVWVNVYSTKKYRLDEWDDSPVFITGRVRTDTVRVKAKYQRLTIAFEVAAPQGNCSFSGNVRSENGKLVAGFSEFSPVSAGRNWLEVQLRGADLQRSGQSGKWDLFLNNVNCNGFGQKQKMQPLPIGDWNAADFEPMPWAFHVTSVKPESIDLVAGGRSAAMVLELNQSGPNLQPGAITVSGLPSAVSYRAPKFVQPRSIIHFFAASEAIPGDYPVRIALSKTYLQREVTAVVRVMPPVSPVAKVPSIDRALNLILVVDRSGSLADCETVVDQTARLADQLQREGHRVSVVAFGAAAAARVDPSPSDIRTIRCGGPTNTTYAIETALKLLKETDDSKRRNVIVLMTDGIPTTLTASFPVRAEADNRCPADLSHYDGTACKEALLPPGTCPADPPTRRAAIAFLHSGVNLPMMPDALSFSAADSEYRELARGCLFGIYPGQRSWNDIAYLPDTDDFGIPLDGKLPMIRFTTGPYQGKIRPDRESNRRRVVNNVYNNLMERIVADTETRPAFETVLLDPMQLNEKTFREHYLVPDQVRAVENPLELNRTVRQILSAIPPL